MNNTTRTDQTIVCADCSQEFVFTAGEQAFYEEKGLEDPKICHICRGIKKAAEKDKEQYTQ